jgi:hypothetical protein
MREYSWLSLSESEIEKEYNTLKNEVVVSTGLQDLLSIRSKSDLLKVIKLLQNISVHQENDAYFKSDKHRQAFLILNNQKGIFDEELGIKKKHYIDVGAAKEWKKKYQTIFHPDKNIDDKSINYDEVMQKVNKIYNRMVGKA